MNARTLRAILPTWPALAWPPHWQALAGLLLLLALALPWTRGALEASMWRHMLLQLPLLALAGALMAAALPARSRTALARWNAQGISGLVLVAVVLAVLMVPRVLDLALRSAGVEAAKFAALVLAGAALRLSWAPAGRIVQGFFLGNTLPMTFVVGQLYVDAPLRLCNAYLLDDQERLGHWLMALAAVLASAWLARVFWQLARAPQQQSPTDHG
ncbi:hypothetical protein SAMN05428957_106173 [Oryzisolibacter propanilivorax]|uniref:Transmembrane protein n=1 Tax=Oryzisolibacter propanilivorax TaxID=1527607 RepID=A0A1G9TJI4_9BURK|nr:hypothetical protein [Oryzisolibacter propanilivorax]SDM47897.1 hypothetical protein SAMN05428957_106173 [Oryzisolibacter propanilivorax]